MGREGREGKGRRRTFRRFRNEKVERRRMTRGNALLPLSLHLSCLSIKTTATSAATSRNDKCAAFPPPSSNDSLLTLFPIAYRTSIVEFPEGKFAILFRLVPLGDGARPLGGRKKKKKKRGGEGERPAHLPSERGGDRQEHRPTLPTGQPNDRLFADGPRKKEGKEIAHRSEEASATNYADLCPHCPLSLSAWSSPRPFQPQPSARP